MLSQLKWYLGCGLKGSYTQEPLSHWRWDVSTSGTWMCSPTQKLSDPLYLEFVEFQYIGSVD